MAPVMILMMVGVMELGTIMFVTTTMESALRDASRFGVTGQGTNDQQRLDTILQVIDARAGTLIDVNAAEIDVKVYPSFASIGEGEEFTDANGNGIFDSGESFIDANGNGQFDADLGEPGPGGADDIVVYTLTFGWELLTPVAQPLFGQDGIVQLGASIAVRNEPFDIGPGAPATVTTGVGAL